MQMATQVQFQGSGNGQRNLILTQQHTGGNQLMQLGPNEQKGKNIASVENSRSNSKGGQKYKNPKKASNQSMIVGKTQKNNFQSRTNINDSFQGIGNDSANYSQNQGYMQAYNQMLNNTGNALDMSAVTQNLNDISILSGNSNNFQTVGGTQV